MSMLDVLLKYIDDPVQYMRRQQELRRKREAIPPEVEARLALIQTDFKIQTAGCVAEKRGAPFDVKDAIGRSAGHRSEDAFVCAADGEIAPVWKDGVAEPRERKAAFGKAEVVC